MNFIKGDQVLVRITESKKWNDTVRDMVQGQQGVIEKVSCRYAGNNMREVRNSDKVKFLVVFPAPIPPPATDKSRSAITGFWFDPSELVMVQAVPGDRCEHDWKEQANHGDVYKYNLVSVGRICSKCKVVQIARLDGGTYEPEWVAMMENQMAAPLVNKVTTRVQMGVVA